MIVVGCGGLFSRLINSNSVRQVVPSALHHLSKYISGKAFCHEPIPSGLETKSLFAPSVPSAIRTLPITSSLVTSVDLVVQMPILPALVTVKTVLLELLLI